jgi:hypothetical protein
VTQRKVITSGNLSPSKAKVSDFIAEIVWAIIVKAMLRISNIHSGT